MYCATVISPENPEYAAWVPHWQTAVRRAGAIPKVFNIDDIPEPFPGAYAHPTHRWDWAKFALPLHVGAPCWVTDVDCFPLGCLPYISHGPSCAGLYPYELTPRVNVGFMFLEDVIDQVRAHYQSAEHSLWLPHAVELAAAHVLTHMPIPWHWAVCWGPPSSYADVQGLHFAYCRPEALDLLNHGQSPVETARRLTAAKLANSRGSS